MSKSLAFSYSDTAFGSPETLNFLRTNVNRGADFAVTKSASGESIITNVTASNDTPEKFRTAYSEVADIYKGSGIEAANKAPSSKGFSIVSQITNIGRVTESVTGETYDLPISAHLVIKAPNDALVTAAVILNVLERLMSNLYGDNVLTTDRLAAIMKGAVQPPEL